MVVLTNSNEQIQGVDASKEIREVSENRIIGSYLQEKSNDRNERDRHELQEDEHECLPNQTLACSCVGMETVNGMEDASEENRTDKDVNDFHVMNKDLHDESEKLLTDKYSPSGRKGISGKQKFEEGQGQETVNIQETTEKAEDKLPIDRGWAWVILLGMLV